MILWNIAIRETSLKEIEVDARKAFNTLESYAARGTSIKISVMGKCQVCGHGDKGTKETEEDADGNGDGGGNDENSYWDEDVDAIVPVSFLVFRRLTNFSFNRFPLDSSQSRNRRRNDGETSHREQKSV